MTRLEQLEGDDYLEKLLDQLNEAQSRWFVAREALLIGRGGINLMQQLTGMSRPTISRGIKEIKQERLPETHDGHRVRSPGGGRRPLGKDDPGLQAAIEKIVDENARRGGVRLLDWTQKSARSIAAELTQQGHAIGARTVRRQLHKMGYSLQAKRSDLKKGTVRERDEQFLYINRQAEKLVHWGAPVVFVDCMKKEYGGGNKDDEEQRHKGIDSHTVATEVLSNDTIIPGSSHDLEESKGFVNVGISSETAEIAFESIQRWWRVLGHLQFPKSDSLLICAGFSGKDESHLIGWKHNLQDFADRFNLSVSVCHLPPGTSKWNWIEPQISSCVNIGCQSRTSVDYKVIVSLISDIITKSGLRPKARIECETATKPSNGQVLSINITPHRTYPDQNYTITSQKK